MRLIDADYVTEKLNEINGTAELDEAFEIVENAPTVCDIEQIIIEITQIDDKNGWIPIDEVFDIILKYQKGGK